MNLFEKNLAALRQMHPDFAFPEGDIDTSGENIEILDATSGEPTARRGGVFLHSRLDPRREARRFITRQADCSCVVFFGFGLGYYVEEYLACNPDGAAIIVEPDPGLFKRALNVRDLTKVFESPGFSLVLNAEPEALAMILNTITVSAPAVAAPKSLVRLEKEYYATLQAVTDSFIARREINRNTLNRFGKRWIRNLAANIRYLPAAHRLQSLEGGFQNMPALLLAAGPSLDAMLEYLPHLADRFVLFAVDTSLRAVLRTGVTPDFLVVVDPQYWNARHLDGCATGGTVLITESATYPAVFRHNYRAVFFGASVFPLGAMLERNLGRFGKIGAGGSVATSAWDAARQMGCSPIFSAGLDLGFPDGATHFKGGRFEEFILCNAERLTPVETGNFTFVNNAAPFLVTSNSGEPVLTDKRLVIYKWWFENQLKMYPDLCCGNLSRNGVRIEGMAYAPATELLDYPLLPRPLPASLISPEIEEHMVLRRREILRNSIGDLIEKLRSLSSLALHACELTRRLDDAGSIDRLNQIDGKLLSHEAKDVAGFLLQSLAQDILDGTQANATIEEVSKQSLRMYETLRDSAEYHIRVLEANTNRI